MEGRAARRRLPDLMLGGTHSRRGGRCGLDDALARTARPHARHRVARMAGRRTFREPRRHGRLGAARRHLGVRDCRRPHRCARRRLLDLAAVGTGRRAGRRVRARDAARFRAARCPRRPRVVAGVRPAAAEDRRERRTHRCSSTARASSRGVPASRGSARGTAHARRDRLHTGDRDRLCRHHHAQSEPAA